MALGALFERAPFDPALVAGQLLDAFAERTGIDAGDPTGRRYLWTDAHAVCGFVALHRLGDRRALARARGLVDLVHRTLGRYRPDDRRAGPLGGIDERTARAHPTAGGLRIGKPLPERGIDEPFDPRAEWDRDGQYFHYLTRWTHALAVLGAEQDDGRPLDWAVELLAVAVARFAHVGRDGRPALHWKLSVDLSRPLVAGTSAHDPLDGWVAALELRAAGAGAGAPGAVLADECALLRSMLGPDLATADPLGIGGLLQDAGRLAELAVRLELDLDDVLFATLGAAERGLGALAHAGGIDGPARTRLAFRELGLAIGLQATPRLAALTAPRASRSARAGAVAASAQRLAGFLPLAERLLGFWTEQGRHQPPEDREHRDIDDVMLAVGLVPSAQLEVPLRGRERPSPR